MLMLGGQADRDPDTDVSITPLLPTVVERLVRPAFPRAVTTSPAMAIYENKPGLCASPIHPGLVVRFREIRRRARNLRISQSKKIRPITAPFRAVDHAQERNAMGPEPSRTFAL